MTKREETTPDWLVERSRSASSTARPRPTCARGSSPQGRDADEESRRSRASSREILEAHPPAASWPRSNGGRRRWLGPPRGMGDGRCSPRRCRGRAGGAARRAAWGGTVGAGRAAARGRPSSREHALRRRAAHVYRHGATGRPSASPTGARAARAISCSSPTARGAGVRRAALDRRRGRGDAALARGREAWRRRLSRRGRGAAPFGLRARRRARPSSASSWSRPTGLRRRAGARRGARARGAGAATRRGAPPPAPGVVQPDVADRSRKPRKETP